MFLQAQASLSGIVTKLPSFQKLPIVYSYFNILCSQNHWLILEHFKNNNNMYIP